jgi:hypothetical protein
MCFAAYVIPLFRAVFDPRGVARDEEALAGIKGLGLPLAALRWLAYVVLFALRDYESAQQPFAEPPFGINLEFYRVLETYTAPLFGALLIAALVDPAVIHSVGWRRSVVIPIHTLFLVWESWATAELVGGRVALKTVDKVVVALLLTVVWISLCAVWWR